MVRRRSFDYVAFKYSNETNIAACISERHITGYATEELKLDGYRLEAVKSRGQVTLYSRRGNDLTKRLDSVSGETASTSPLVKGSGSVRVESDYAPPPEHG